MHEQAKPQTQDHCSADRLCLLCRWLSHVCVSYPSQEKLAILKREREPECQGYKTRQCAAKANKHQKENAPVKRPIGNRMTTASSTQPAKRSWMRLLRVTHKACQFTYAYKPVYAMSCAPLSEYCKHSRVTWKAPAPLLRAAPSAIT